MNVVIKQRIFSLCLVIATFWGTNTEAQEWFVSTSDGNGADTYLSNDGQHGPTAVHGAGGSLAVRFFGDLTSTGPPDFTDIFTGVRARLAMMRFDVSGISDFTDTRLQIMQTFGTRDRTLQVYGLNDGIDWDEASTSYSNAPGVDDSAELGLYVMDLDQVTHLGTLNVFDVRTIGPQLLTSSPDDLPLDNFLANHPNGLATLFLAYNLPPNTDSNPDFAFASKENGDGYIAPRLTNVPEPSSLALSSLVLVGLLLRRRNL